MRGNEASELMNDAMRAMFPIPMRGNEERVGEDATDLELLYEFPIPMRGNESLVSCSSLYQHFKRFRSP